MILKSAIRHDEVWLLLCIIHEVAVKARVVAVKWLDKGLLVLYT